MFWFIIPVVIVALLIAVAVAIYVANARRHAGAPGRQGGQTVYDSRNPPPP